MIENLIVNRKAVKVQTEKGQVTVFQCQALFSFLTTREGKVIRKHSASASALNPSDAMQLCLMVIEEWADKNREEVKVFETGLLEDFIAAKVKQ